MSIPTPDEYFDRIHRVISVLDDENIKIINTMKKNGPRNLQDVSRKSGVPYPTVYTRVNKLETQGLLRTWVYPNFSRIGLSRAMVLLTTSPGRELLARDALKVPGYWLRITRCTGDCNGYYSLHAVPANNKQDFEQYVDQIVSSGLASDSRILWLDEYTSNIPNFEHFDLKNGRWKFSWASWLKALTPTQKPRKKAPANAEGQANYDKNDLLILKELMKDARKKLSEFAKLIGVTLPAAKYRFDNLLRRGLVQDYVIDILPYPPEISDLYEMRLDFRDEETLLAEEKVLQRLPFILGCSKIRGTNAASVRVFLPRGELNNLLTLLSALVRRKILDRFSYLVFDFMTIEAQTFSYEHYANGSGWHYDNHANLAGLRKLASSLDKQDHTVSFTGGAASSSVHYFY
ncbi:MAG: hypothetical protein AUJ07_07335 [Crenarchaeota archaeon 13_1_40CM_3_53_5]|nr:MAG: hypothetical protein AUJ07_07335 [Crenarchaeota archaeon 13_1_40CM_3_53_5]